MTIDELGALYLKKRTELLLQRVPLDGWIVYVSTADVESLCAQHRERFGTDFPFTRKLMGATWEMSSDVPAGEIRLWRKCMKLDAKFYGDIRKVKDDSRVPDDEYVVFLAKDNAFAAVLPLYRAMCAERSCDAEQLAAVDRMIERVRAWRDEHPERCKNPDAANEKLLG